MNTSTKKTNDICPFCIGEKYVDDEWCHRCLGTGYILAKEDDWKQNSKDIMPEIEGMKLEDAIDLAAPLGWIIRTTRNNGHYTLVTGDIKMNRIDVHTNNGVITEVVGIG